MYDMNCYDSLIVIRIRKSTKLLYFLSQIYRFAPLISFLNVYVFYYREIIYSAVLNV